MKNRAVTEGLRRWYKSVPLCSACRKIRLVRYEWRTRRLCARCFRSATAKILIYDRHLAPICAHLGHLERLALDLAARSANVIHVAICRASRSRVNFRVTKLSEDGRHIFVAEVGLPVRSIADDLPEDILADLWRAVMAAEATGQFPANDRSKERGSGNLPEGH